MKTHTHFLKYFLLAVTALGLPTTANAVFPTFDAKATQSSIETNVNVVKQTKEIQDVKEMSGKINSSIGSATASISKFKSENIEKIQEKAEKVKKEKERIEKKKAEYEKIKKDIDDYKAQVKEMKELADDYRKQATDLKDTVKDVSAMSGDLSSLAKTGLSTATSAAGSTFGVSDEISAVKSTVSSAKQTATSAVSQTVPSASNYINSNNKDYSDEPQYEASVTEEVEDEIVAPTRASFGVATVSAPKVLLTNQANVSSVSSNTVSASNNSRASTNQEAQVLATPSVSAASSASAAPSNLRAAVSSNTPVATAQQTTSSSGFTQRQENTQTQIQGQSKAQSVAVSSPDVAMNNEVSSYVAGGSSGIAEGYVSSGQTITNKRVYTKPTVTHQAYYKDKNMVNNRKSVMGAIPKAANRSGVGSASNQGNGRSLVSSSSNDFSAEDSEQIDSNATDGVSSTQPNQQAQQGFFADEYSEETEVVTDENGEVVEDTEEVVERYIPVQKPEVQAQRRGKRVPFGAKVNSPEMEKELKALEAQDALEKKNIEDKKDKQSFKFSEQFAFAQLGGVGGVTVYDNYIDGKFALSSKFVYRCKKNAKDLADVEALKTCVAEFAKCLNDPNETAASACKEELNEILSDQVLNTLAIAMEKKNIASGFEEKVVEKTAKDAAAAKDERADFTVNATINEELMKVINDNTDLLAIQVILKSMEGFKDIRVDDVEVEETSAE